MFYDFAMTNVDVLFRYEHQPSEAAMFAMGNLKEVYGIRRIEIDQPHKTIRVEYDATRLTSAVVANLLRRGGISLIEELPLVPPQSPIQHPDASQPPVVPSSPK
jgi:copper chaperone CopZ